MIGLNDIIGFAGLFLILTAFILNILKKIKTESSSYNMMNLFGALALAYYSYGLNAIPLFILQCIWGVFALYNLIK